MTSKLSTLIFVYNAKGGLFNAITDYIHKNISPETYECNLCAITYDNFGMKKDWKNFLKSLEVEKIFLHKEEFEKDFPQFKDSSLPLILAKTKDKVEILFSSKELNDFKNQEELMAGILGRV